MMHFIGQAVVSLVILGVGAVVLVRKDSSTPSIDAVSGLMSMVAGFWLR